MKKLKQKALSSIRMIWRTNTLLFANNKANKRLFLIGFVLSCIITQMWTVDSWMFGQLTNRIVGQKSVFTGLPLIIAVIANFLVDVIPGSLQFARRKLELRFREISTEQTQRFYWQSYAKFDLQDRENPQMQDALNNANRNQSAIQEIFFLEWNLILSVLTVIVAAVMLSFIEWWYFIVVIAMITPRMYFSRKRKVRRYAQEKRLNEVQRYKDTLSSYIGTKESILNSSRSHFLGMFDSIRSRLNFFEYRNNEHFAIINYWGNMWFYTLLAFMVFSLITKVEHHEATVGTLFILFGSISRMSDSLDQATTGLIDLEIASKKAEDFFLVVDSAPAIQDVSGAIDVDDTIVPHIEFDDVYFKYPGSKNYVLQGVSFVINPGETIGLIAKNGEGKTTIGMLLLRFYDPDKGSIRVNGIDLRLLKRESLLNITGALFQDFTTLKTTIRSAILATRPGYPCSDFQVWQILERVGLKEYTEKLPNQLHQKVDRIFKDSVKLSGGQNQKLGLAGLMLRDPKLVLLDEFTSALDPEAEKEIVEQYKTVIKDKTALIISHRYMSLKIVDRIIVLHNGKIVENGKKSDLMVIEGGIFRKLYKAAEFAINQN